MAKKKTKGTKTSSFGSSEKISHDSSRLYKSKIYEGIQGESEIEYLDTSEDFPKNLLNTTILGDSRNMEKIPDNSIHLILTSPPYNVTKEYDDNLTLPEYLQFLKEVFQEGWRVLATGGRVAINIANVGRKPYLPLHMYLTQVMIDLGFLMRGMIIWDKGMTGNSMAWGSWQSASNPTLRDTNEFLLIFSKDKFKRIRGGKKDSIKKGDFINWTRSIWTFPPESAKRIGHPAPFPIELPRRLIELYSFEGDIILDPFMGSGTTGLAALKARRNFVGYEREPEYVKLSQKRTHAWKGQFRMTDFIE